MARRIVALGYRPSNESAKSTRAPRVVEAFDPSKIVVKATSLTPEENYQASKIEIVEAFQTVGNAYLDKGISHATSKDVMAAMLGVLCPGERKDARLWERTIDLYFKAENVLALNAKGSTAGRGGGIYFAASEEATVETPKPSKPGKSNK